MGMSGEARNIFDLGEMSANMENEAVACTNKVVKRANISANIMLGKMLNEMLHRSTRALS